jgi:hypothetical protein
MTRRKSNIVWPHLNDGGGYLDKSWYVEYSLRNLNNKMERFRHYDGFKEINSKKERVLYAKKLIEELTKKIKSGEVGFSETVEYEDMLTYGGNNYFAKKKKTHTSSFKFYISDFLEYKKLEINTKTLQTYRSKFRIFVSFLGSKNLSDKPVSIITNELIIEFLKAIVTERGLSRKSVEKYQQIMYTFFSYLIDVKYFKIKNPVLNYFGFVSIEARFKHL